MLFLLVLMRLDHVVKRSYISLGETYAAVVNAIVLCGLICDFLIHRTVIYLTMRQDYVRFRKMVIVKEHQATYLLHLKDSILAQLSLSSEMNVGKKNTCDTSHI